MDRSLREFLSALDEAGELHRITAKVSPMLEISEIADRVSKSPAPSMSETAARTDPRHHHQVHEIEGSYSHRRYLYDEVSAEAPALTGEAPGRNCGC